MMRDEPLSNRLYFTPALYELARLVSYGGVWEAALQQHLKPLVEKHGADAMREAVLTVTVTNETTRLVVLKPAVRKACWQLLGPQPDHPLYQSYWEQRGGPPAHHQLPKQKEGSHAQPAPPPRPAAGLDAEAYALDARRRNKRQLLCMLRDARKKLVHHGKRSFAGKEAKKEAAAAEAELQCRGMDIPPEGQETAEWDRSPAVVSPTKQTVKKK